MRYLENFSNFEPRSEDLDKWINYIKQNYQIDSRDILDKKVKFVMIDDKPKDITGSFAKKGEIVDLIFNEISYLKKNGQLEQLPEIHEPTVRRAIKDWIEESRKFDVDFAIAKIKEQFPFEKVKEMLDNEVLEWTPEDESESYYVENSNGEAEDAVITHLIDWYVSKYPSSYSDENVDTLRDAIQKTYPFLNY
jgi:hypothetical protein